MCAGEWDLPIQRGMIYTRRFYELNAVYLLFDTAIDLRTLYWNCSSGLVLYARMIFIIFYSSSFLLHLDPACRGALSRIVLSELFFMRVIL